MPNVTLLLSGEARIPDTVRLMPMPTVLSTISHPLKWESGDLVRQIAHFDSFYIDLIPQTEKTEGPYLF